MKNLLIHVTNGQSQIVYDEVCKFVLSPEKRTCIMKAMWAMPMLFDLDARATSPMVGAHLQAAGVADTGTTTYGYWYSVYELAVYACNLPTYYNKAIPEYRLEGRPLPAPAAYIIDTPRVRRTPRFEPPLPEPLEFPRLEFDLDCTEEGTVWARHDYTKYCCDARTTTDFDEDSIRELGETAVTECGADIDNDRDELTDWQQNDDTILFDNVVYHDRNGNEHDLGNQNNAAEIEEAINDINTDLDAEEEAENEEE